MDIVTNCMEASLDRPNYSLWTNLLERKSGISKVALGELKDQVSYTWVNWAYQGLGHFVKWVLIN